ncbi:MAG: hypothetical protein Greene071436_303, partial [Parcubacteria group bacterium Greene0714_36]
DLGNVYFSEAKRYGRRRQANTNNYGVAVSGKITRQRPDPAGNFEGD